MSDVVSPVGLVAEIQRLQKRVAVLERAVGTQRFTTANRPPAASMPGAIIFNTTTGKHEASDGTAWNALY